MNASMNNFCECLCCGYTGRIATGSNKRLACPICDSECLANLERVYISGPVTGKPDQNATAFYFASFYVSRTLKGHPVNPLTLNHDGNKTWVDFMRTDLSALVQCDSIIMLPGWLFSKGAVLEYIAARFLGMRVYHAPKSVVEGVKIL